MNTEKVLHQAIRLIPLIPSHWTLGIFAISDLISLIAFVFVLILKDRKRNLPPHLPPLHLYLLARSRWIRCVFSSPQNSHPIYSKPWPVEERCDFDAKLTFLKRLVLALKWPVFPGFVPRFVIFERPCLRLRIRPLLSGLCLIHQIEIG